MFLAPINPDEHTIYAESYKFTQSHKIRNEYANNFRISIMHELHKAFIKKLHPLSMCLGSAEFKAA